MRHPVWCQVCGKPYQARTKKDPCPSCWEAAAVQEAAARGGLDKPLVNTMAPPADEGRLLAERFGTEAPRDVFITGPLDEIECPHCAERIKARAKVCKHCGNDVLSPSKKGRRAKTRDQRPVHSGRYAAQVDPNGRDLQWLALMLGVIGICFWPLALAGAVVAVVNIAKRGSGVFVLILCTVFAGLGFAVMLGSLGHRY